MPQVELKIAKEWDKHSDLRLTQLLVNVIKPSESCSEIYYVEDSKLIELLNELTDEELKQSGVSTNAIDELLMLYNEMLAFFNSKEDIDAWIHTKLTALGGEKPISLLPTA